MIRGILSLNEIKEHIKNIAHLGHVELLTPTPDDSFKFFQDILGMEEVYRKGQSVYLRGWGQYEQYCMKLTESDQAGVAHTSFRTVSPQALERCADNIKKTGLGIGWTDGDFGHGKSYQFKDPDGHIMELYYETEKYVAPDHLKPILKNQPQKFTGRGAGVRQLDHVNFLAQTVHTNSDFIRDNLSMKVNEEILLDNGLKAGSWLYCGEKSYDLVYSMDAMNANGRLHHLAFLVDTWEDLKRAADIYIEHNLVIEGGPAKHTINQTMYLYVFEPGGNRIELCTGGYRITAPDFETITWSEEERSRGQAWLNATIKSFHTYGTPVIKEKVNS